MNSRQDRPAKGSARSWSGRGPRWLFPEVSEGTQESIAALFGALGGEEDEDRTAGFSSNVAFDQVTFDENGGQTVVGGRLAAYGGAWKWECIRQEGTSLQVSELMEDMEYLGLQVDFASDDEVRIGISYGDAVLPAAVYRRQKGATPVVDEAAKPVAVEVAR